MLRARTGWFDITLRCPASGCGGRIHASVAKPHQLVASGCCDACGRRYTLDHGVLAPEALRAGSARRRHAATPAA